MNIREWLFKKVFSDSIPFKWIDGHKEELVKFFTFLFAVAALLGQFFPEYQPWISSGTAGLLTLLGLLGIPIAKVHKSDKAKLDYGKK